jgi:hypothetical protein
LFRERFDDLREFTPEAENDLGGLEQLGDHGGRRGLTAEAWDVRKNPFMLREPQHERDSIFGTSST